MCIAVRDAQTLFSCQQESINMFSYYPYSSTIHFNDTILQFSDQVTHLGYLLTYNLDERPDIIRVVKDINCKANSVLCTFSSADPFVKCYLIKVTVYLSTDVFSGCFILRP